MTHVKKVPASLLVASLVLMLQFALLLVGGYLQLPVVQAALVLLLGFALILGSRIGWTLSLLAAGLDVAARFSGDEPTWMLGLDGMLLFALLLPSTFHFVWTARHRRRFLQARQEGAKGVIDAGLSSRAMDFAARLPYGVIAWRLGFSLMVLLVLSGMVDIWEKGSGSGSSVVGVLATFSDLLFSVVLLAFVVSLCAWAYGSYGRRPQDRVDRKHGKIS